MEQRWRELDSIIRHWWDGDLVTALEADIRADDAQTLLFLPYPYSPAAGNLGAYPELYGWDTYFINLGLLAHARYDVVRHHILNQLSMIDRFGMVLNGNRTFYLTRSQPPLLPDSIWRYFEHTRDRLMLYRAYASLKNEFDNYWNAEHHQTPTGLATNRDLGDPNWRPELAAEAETGLDFTACFAGDVRQCVPLITNCVLVRYAEVLKLIATEVGAAEDSVRWQAEYDQRARRINELCWNVDQGLYFEYNFARGEQIPVKSLSAYWPLWAGITDETQATALVDNLSCFEQEFGLAFTDQAYDIPHPEFSALQWSYPVGWPPMHTIIAESLIRSGFKDAAKRVSQSFLNLVLKEYNRTGNLWEKYNVVSGDLTIPLERAGSAPFHGWTSAAVVGLGRILFDS